MEAAKAAQEKLRKELETTKATEDKQRKELEAVKAAQEKLRKESETDKAELEKRRKEEADKAAQEKRRKEEADKADKAEQDKRQKAADAVAKKLEADRKREEQQSEKLRKDQLERTMKQVPGTGTGAQTGSPDAEYGAKVREAIRPHFLLIKEVSLNLTAEYLLKTVANGKIVDAKLTKSSGDTYFDDVALKAILKTERLPPDKDGKVPSPMVIVISP